MLPAVAAHAIATYSKRGDLVIDPMCGVGTTLTEAIYLDRMAIGVEIERRSADVATRNLESAVDQGASGFASVRCGDAREIDLSVGKDVHGKAALVLTSLESLVSHGFARHSLGSRRAGSAARRSYDTQGAVSRRSVERSLDHLTQILTACHVLLRPDGFLVMTARQHRHSGQTFEALPLASQAALGAGYTLHERCTALLTAASEDYSRTAHAPLFQLVNESQAFSAGGPTHGILHEEIVVFRKSREPAAQHVADNADDAGCGCIPLVRNGAAV